MNPIRSRLTALGHDMPDTPPPAVASYLPCVEAGGFVFVSGQLPLQAGEPIAKGPGPSTLLVDQAKAAAASPH